MQIPNAGDDNQSCHISTVILNLIKQLQMMYYTLYSITVIYTHVTISTVI